MTQSVRSSSGDMALRLSHVTGHRHWYFYVLALVCVGWWNAAVLVLPRPPPPAAAHNDVVGPRSPSEHRLINLTDFRYAGGGGTARQLQSSMRFVIRHCSCLSVTFVSKHSKLLPSNQFRVRSRNPSPSIEISGRALSKSHFKVEVQCA